MIVAMLITQRIRLSARAACLHLAASAVVAALVAWVVFAVWYPYPYREVSGGKGLFLLLVAVDVVLGPLLTLVLYHPAKQRRELILDLSLVALLQLGALAYGVFSVHAARPVFLSFEGSRFRVVSAAEIDPKALGEARYGLGDLSQWGPVTIAAKLANPGDKDYLASVQQSMQGLHPSLRPARWEPYDAHRQAVVGAIRPMVQLREGDQARRLLIDRFVAEHGLEMASTGYLPLQSRTHADWIVVLDRRTGDVRGFLPIDGW